VNIGILGLGTVGGGVVNVLNKNQSEITRRSALGILIKIEFAQLTILSLLKTLLRLLIIPILILC